MKPSALFILILLACKLGFTQTYHVTGRDAAGNYQYTKTTVISAPPSPQTDAPEEEGKTTKMTQEEMLVVVQQIIDNDNYGNHEPLKGNGIALLKNAIHSGNQFQSDDAEHNLVVAEMLEKDGDWRANYYFKKAGSDRRVYFESGIRVMSAEKEEKQMEFDTIYKVGHIELVPKKNKEQGRLDGDSVPRVEDIVTAIRAGEVGNVRNFISRWKTSYPRPHEWNRFLAGAIRANQLEIAVCFFENGSDPAYQEYGMKSALHYLVENPFGEMEKDFAQRMVEKSPTLIGLSDKHGNTPLHNAIISAPKEIDWPKFLLENGAHIDTKNNEGNTPKYLAMQTNNGALIELLQQYEKVTK